MGASASRARGALPFLPAGDVRVPCPVRQVRSCHLPPLRALLMAMRRSVIDLVPAQQRTYMAAFTLIAQHIAAGEGAVVTGGEISAITKYDAQMTRAHLIDLGRDLLDVEVTDSRQVCVRGLHGEGPPYRLGK